MIELLQFIFASLEHFLGTLILLFVVGGLVSHIIHRLLDAANVHKHGWPPDKD